ncbi:MAG: signal peptidase II, partial [Halomonas sp.]|nr:signal peptidase II [Halomonas sp.]
MRNSQDDSGTSVPPMRQPLRWLWLAAAVVLLDLGTKALMSSLLSYGQPVEVLPFF